MKRGGHWPPLFRSALFSALHRAGIDAQQRIGRAGLQNAGCQRHDADQQQLVQRPTPTEKKSQKQNETHHDPQDAVEPADIGLEHESTPFAKYILLNEYIPEVVQSHA